MNRSLRKHVTIVAFSGIAIVALLAARVLFAGEAQSDAGKGSTKAVPVRALTPYVEEHTHFDEKDIPGTVRAALAAIEKQNAAMVFLEIPPETFDDAGHYDAEAILPAVKKYPNQIRVIGGGGSLNSMIVQSVITGDSGPEIQKKFRARAEELLNEGVIGFGEMTETASAAGRRTHAPPNALYYLLADILPGT